jgi:hypothetical protein
MTLRAAAGWITLVVLAAPARAGDERWIATVSTARLAAPDAAEGGELESFGSGGALSITWLEHCRSGRLCGALDSSALFLRGDDGARLYDLSASIMGSFSLENPVAPFLAVGLDLVSAAVPESGGAMTRGVGLGVHGNVGLHAWIGERFYARGQLGYLGAAVGGVKGELGIGTWFE